MTDAIVQQLAVAAILLVAATYLGRKVWRTVKSARTPKGPGCGGDCCGH